MDTFLLIVKCFGFYAAVMAGYILLLYGMGEL